VQQKARDVYALRRGHLFQHAWITIDGIHAVDVTFQDISDCQFFGIPFHLNTILEEIRSRGDRPFPLWITRCRWKQWKIRFVERLGLRPIFPLILGLAQRRPLFRCGFKYAEEFAAPATRATGAKYLLKAPQTLPHKWSRGVQSAGKIGESSCFSDSRGGESSAHDSWTLLHFWRSVECFVVQHKTKCGENCPIGKLTRLSFPTPFCPLLSRPYR
jgi:hypothetical protein